MKDDNIPVEEEKEKEDTTVDENSFDGKIFNKEAFN